jgi:hypothetical protein
MTQAFESSLSIDKAPPDFWENVSYELFTNVQDLYEPIETFFSTMSPGDGFPAMLVRNFGQYGRVELIPPGLLRVHMWVLCILLVEMASM